MKIILICFLFIPCFASARVFDFNKETIAAYLRGTGVLSNVGDKAFGDSSGTSTSTTDKVAYNFGGEFGAMFALAQGVSFRAGLELYQAKPLPSVSGKNASGAELFALKSTVFSWGPIATLEFVVLRGASYRGFLFGGAGYSTVTMENEYTMTTLGAATLVPSYTEKSEATAIYGFTGAGLEAELADTTTIAVDVGYHYFPVSKFTYKSNETTIQGAKSKGGTVVNDDGKTRSLDLGGVTFSVSLRFYIDLI